MSLPPASPAALPLRPARGARRRRRLLAALVAVGLVLLALAATGIVVLQRAGWMPRSVGLTLVERGEARGGRSGALAVAAGRVLSRLDPVGGDVTPALHDGAPWPLSAQARGTGGSPSASAPAPRVQEFADPSALREALAQARPGDVLRLLPGTWTLERALRLERPGTPQAPITLQAARPGTVVLVVTGTVGLRLSAPHWRVEGLTLRGGCAVPGDCEHALHVVGAARGAVIRGNRLVDFNAALKVNGEDGRFPDDGLFEGNVVTATAPRDTDRPVNGMDLVGVDGWLLRGNRVSDLVKRGGDRVSVGGFAKGAGRGNRFVGNHVRCEERLRGLPGQRVGLSLGGGGTAPAYCRDRRCVVEQEAGVIEGNLIESCSDDGIHLLRAAGSRVSDNTVLDTAGVVLRHPESTARVEGNAIDGPLRVRDGARVDAGDNLVGGHLPAWVGWHPVRARFDRGTDLPRWRDGGTRRRDGDGAVAAAWCDRPRPAGAAYGAFDADAASADCPVPRSSDQARTKGSP